jgi:site-specific DNA-methyltransferase (adenine-specific)
MGETVNEPDLICGDLFDVLPEMAENSIDACVTDPPYGIGFMGREWDTFKPGVEQARIIESTQIASTNPNLKGRKRAPASSPSAVEYDRSLQGQRAFQDWNAAWAAEVLRVLKPGGHMLVFGAPRSHHRMIAGLEDAGFEIRDCLAWIFGQGFPKSLNLGDGLGTALKPGQEPIALARKPFEGTTTAIHALHGTGALNIEACRIGTDDTRSVASPTALGIINDDGWVPQPVMAGSACGRWPANVLLSEEAAASLDEHTGVSKSNGRVTDGPWQPGSQTAAYADSGGASRFFYVAKPSRRERDFGCEHLPEKSGGDSTGREDGTDGLKSPRAGAGRGGGARNFHPTVKPVALMRYLVKLITPVGGVVLDPFLGSGTTGMAARYENRGFVGIEREEDYFYIAMNRVFAVDPDTEAA